jgi:hypothetical protein
MNDSETLTSLLPEEKPDGEAFCVFRHREAIAMTATVALET